MRPDLILVGHGTRDPRGPQTLGRLAASVRSALPHVRVRLAYVELVEPLIADLMANLQRPTIVVPLLLSTGYHVKHDLSSAIASASGGPVTLTEPLGPSRLLVAALVDRLAQSGALPGDPLVLAAAGSSDADAGRAVRRTAGMLATAWRAPVLCAYASMGVTVAEALADLRRAGHRRGSVATYLLAPGRFATDVRRAAATHGVRATDVLGTHPAIVELTRRRYRLAEATQHENRDAEQPTITVGWDPSCLQLHAAGETRGFPY